MLQIQNYSKIGHDLKFCPQGTSKGITTPNFINLAQVFCQSCVNRFFELSKCYSFKSNRKFEKRKKTGGGNYVKNGHTKFQWPSSIRKIKKIGGTETLKKKIQFLAPNRPISESCKIQSISNFGMRFSASCRTKLQEQNELRFIAVGLLEMLQKRRQK